MRTTTEHNLPKSARSFWLTLVALFAITLAYPMRANAQESYVIFDLQNLVADASHQVNPVVYIVYHGESMFVDSYYESEQRIEDWMVKKDGWGLNAAESETAEEEIEVEGWMTHPFEIERNEFATEEEMKVECWMVTCEWI